MEFRSCFYMPNGFANEGVYLWGRTKELDNFLNTLDYAKSNVGIIRNHRCARTAGSVARKACERDIRNTPDHEISSISHCRVRDFWADPGVRVGRPSGIFHSRFNITMPNDLHERFCEFCLKTGDKKSRLIATLVRDHLDKEKRRRASAKRD